MQTSRIPYVAAVALLLGRPAVAQDAPDVPAPERRADSLFAEYAQGIRPGLAFAVVRDGRVLLAKGYGYANLEHRAPITRSTVFDVASVSKQFAGLAIATLVEQGRVKLTDDVRTHVPAMGDVGRTITIDHLVHHTSGLRDWPGTLSLAGWRYDDVISYDQILRLAYAQRSLNFAPGAEYTYSNTGYNLLAETVARVTGQSFVAWTDSAIFRPLGMSSSRFQADHARVIPNRASGYLRGADGAWRAVTNNLTALGSSSLFSTVDDMARWLANLDDAKVGGAAVARMRTRGRLNDGTTIPYAFGLSHGEHRGEPTLSHSGSWAAFTSFLLHVPARRFGVVVLANGGVNASRAAYALADLFLDAELAPRPAPAASPTVPDAPVAAIALAALDRWAGLYRLGPGWYVRVRRDGGVLRTQATREPEFPMTPRSDSTFWVAAYDAPMEFERGTAGAPPHLRYRGRRFPRLAESAPARLAEYTGVYESDELGTRYAVVVRNDTLVLRHARHGDIALAHLWRDDFGGSASFTRSVEFRRDAAGTVVGFSVFVDERSRDVRFERAR